MKIPLLSRPRLTRRRFLATLLVTASAAAGAAAADAAWLEPTWLQISHLRLGTGKPAHRFVHFTDLHHKGDRDYLKAVVDRINFLKPDFVCFTGDIIEEDRFLADALELLGGIQAPLYGVPGNHDYWSKASFETIRNGFKVRGGRWLMDEQCTVATGGGKINLIGITCSHDAHAHLPLDPSAKNILLMHYPAWVKNLGGQRFDLMLAGHSHGGQVRIPFYGPVITPFAVDEYSLGLYQTTAGPLYVNAGIGYIYGYKFRFNCRPEITVIEI